MFENKEGEITVLFHSEKSDDVKARGYAESLPSQAIHTLDMLKDPLTETQLAELANKMKVPILDLLDSSYDEHTNKAEQKKDYESMEDSELLKLLANNPKLIATPIVIWGSQAKKVGSAYEFIKGLPLTNGDRAQSANPTEK